jgi:hypothetical protein
MLKNKVKVLEERVKRISNTTMYLPVLIVRFGTDLNKYKEQIGPNTVIITRGGSPC